MGVVDVFLVSPHDAAEVEALLDACPTSVAQQTLAWRNVVVGMGQDEAMCLGCRQSESGKLVGFLPAYRFEGPLGAILVSCAQVGSLGGVVSHPQVDRRSVYQALLQAFVDLAISKNCAVATVISNPFYPDSDLCERHLAPDYVLENTCQVLDLKTAMDDGGDLVAPTAKLRHNLRRASCESLSIDEEQDSRNVDDWYSIHKARHCELGVTPLPKQIFDNALEELIPEDKGRFFFVRLADSGEMVGGGMFLSHGGVADMLMTSTLSKYRQLRPNYLLALRAMRWARKRGVQYFNWQGSPPDSGVHKFKHGWGSYDVSYCFLTRVTGDVTPLLNAAPRDVKAAYPWHYVLPFDQIGAGRSRTNRRSSRDGAWKAGEAVE